MSETPKAYTTMPPEKPKTYTTVTPVEAYAAEDGAIYSTWKEADARNQLLFNTAVGQLFHEKTHHKWEGSIMQMGKDLQPFLDAVYPLLKAKKEQED